jgi:hypothetical protein
VPVDVSAERGAVQALSALEVLGVSNEVLSRADVVDSWLLRLEALSAWDYQGDRTYLHMLRVEVNDHI